MDADGGVPVQVPDCVKVGRPHTLAVVVAPSRRLPCDRAARCAAVARAWCAPTAAGAAAANLTDVSSTDVSATDCRYSSVVCAARSACVWEGRADDGATLALFVTQLDATWSLLTLVVVCRQEAMLFP